MRRIIIVFSLVFLLSYSYGNDTLRTKNLSIGIKLAVPNFLIGLSGEYGGFFHDRISVITNISYLPEFNIVKDFYYKSQNYSIGVNYYLLRNKKAFIGLGFGTLKTKYIFKNQDLYFDVNFNAIDADLTYSTNLVYLKPSFGYNFTIGSFYLRPEIEYYLTNYSYSPGKWESELENGEIRDGRELLNLDFESLNISLTLGYNISFK